MYKLKNYKESILYLIASFNLAGFIFFWTFDIFQDLVRTDKITKDLKNYIWIFGLWFLVLLSLFLLQKIKKYAISLILIVATVVVSLFLIKLDLYVLIPLVEGVIIAILTVLALFKDWKFLIGAIFLSVVIMSLKSYFYYDKNCSRKGNMGTTYNPLVLMYYRKPQLTFYDMVFNTDCGRSDLGVPLLGPLE